MRANVLTEIDGAIGLLNLDARVKAMDIGKLVHFSCLPLFLICKWLIRFTIYFCCSFLLNLKDYKEKDIKISAMAREKHLEPHFLDNHEHKNHQEKVLNNDHDAAADQSGIDSDDYGTEDFEGIRFSQTIVDLKDVQGIENFNIHVDGLIVDSEIPSHLRIKYYELCCSQNSYLHEQLLKGLNLKLVAGIISETINIADAIRSCKLTTSCDNLKVWDNTLKAFEDLGMKVGFLRARINKLETLSSGSEEVVNCKRLELVEAEEEMRVLEIKLSNVKDVIKDLDGEIEVLKMKGEKLEVVFREEAKAPW